MTNEEHPTGPTEPTAAVAPVDLDAPRPEHAARPGRSRLPLLLVAIVAVAGLLGFWMVASRGPGSEPGGGGAPPEAGAGAIWGAQWTITVIERDAGSDTVASGSGVSPLPDGSAPVLDTATEGRVGFTGCNGGQGRAVLQNDKLMVDGMASTRLACGGPDGSALMAQDRTVADILEGGPTVAIDGDVIALTSAGGRIQATRIAL